MKNAKPILTIGVGMGYKKEEIKSLERQLSEKFPDYHTLIYHHNKIDIPIFNVLNGDGLEPLRLDKLEKFLLSQIDSL